MLAALLLTPLATGLVSFFARRRRAMEIVNLAGFAATLGIALATAAEVLQTGAASQFGGFLYADHFSALALVLTAAIAFVCAVYAVGYLRADEVSGAFDDAPAKLRKYYVLTPLFVSAMLLVTVANNLGVMWVAVEATTLASVFLVTFYGKVTSLEAAWKYAIIGGVGLSMALFGTVLAYYSGYRAFGGAESVAALNWSTLVQRAAQLDHTTLRLAFMLALLGYGTKAGLAPMHTWKPDAYSEAPVPAAAILSSATMNCAMYALVRFYILTERCLGQDFPGGLLMLFGLLSIAVAVPFILVQKNLRRMLAYCSIEHAGIMAVALGIGGPLGALALMLHMTSHSAAKPLLFLCAGNVSQHFGTDRLRDIKGGAIRALPLTGAVFVIAVLAITGSPPFGLFQSEFLVLRAAVAQGHYAAVALFVAAGAAIFAGMMLHAVRLTLGPDTGAPRGRWQPWRHSSLLGLAAATAILGFWLPAPLMELIRGAARVVAGR